MTEPVLSATPAARRKAKIVATLGPSSNTEPILRQLVRAGMDVARLNFSHGTHEQMTALIALLRDIAATEGKTICIMQDLQGPKIRTGRLQDRRPVALALGSQVTITPRDVLGSPTLISTTFQTLAREVGPGSIILLSDGLIELRVTAVKGDDVETDVINGGLLGEHKGINLPGAVVTVPSLTQKDLDDLEFGLAQGVDMVAVSFIRSAADVRAVKERIAFHNSDAWVIAKLEKPQAIEHLEEILDEADGVMVARGDLGVEMPPEKVPIIQKHVIRRAAEWRKPVITATQMLESMIENPRPTRAEASDVANAIFDGSDAVMLSGETAMGRHPREAVAMMAKIIIETESHMRDTGLRQPHELRPRLSISETICESVAHAAEDLDMAAIVVYTETGTTARLISKYRPQPEIYALTAVSRVCNRLNLLWGVSPLARKHEHSTEDMVSGAEAVLLREGIVKPGDIVGLAAGTQTTSGSTNFMRLHIIGGDHALPAEDKATAQADSPATAVVGG